jgi:tetratricopeptide (TPR) repeat protein
MKTTKLLVALLSIIPIAGTLAHYLPQAREAFLALRGKNSARHNLLLLQVKQSSTIFRIGDFNHAATLFEQGYRDALRAGEPQIAARFLNNLGGCRFALHQYRAALETYIEARKLAESVHDNATAAKLDLNISSLYAHFGQMDLAADAIGRATARLSGSERLSQLPKLLTHLAALQADQGHLPQALDLYRQGIAAADRAGDREMYAFAWNDLGYVYLEHGQLPQAEHALLEAYRVRKLLHLRSIEGCYRNLGMLRLEQGDVGSASILLDRAVALSAQPGGLSPTWEVHYARGRVRMQQNRLPEALYDLRIAARLARNWRREAFPDDATRISAENMIQKVHSELVNAGGQLYFSGRGGALSQETFESAEANRAASLRALLGGPPDHRVAQLQGALNQWESRAGSNTDVEFSDILDRTRRMLEPDAAFLAFHLATPHSYLWAVSREQFALYRLPPGPEIAALAARFAKAVREGSGESQPAGAQIFHELFGQLAPEFRQKTRWLLALDVQLFEMPFAAMIEETGPRGPKFLAERHSLQITSGAAMLTRGSLGGISSGPFVGVADPIYNMADPRWKQPPSAFSFFTARAAETAPGVDLLLARLPGSAREVADCAKAWSDSRASILLEGSSASRQGMQAALKAHPSILHFATHVLHSPQTGRSGMVVLSLTQGGRHDVLSPAEVATWNLEGALVSLSGCSSGSADALPATGLMGLTRACQAAGASAVVASHWPTPDDAGALFLSFYGHLRATPKAGPAVALQHAQIDMLQSRTWRSNPLYWSAYFVTGNQQ